MTRLIKKTIFPGIILVFLLTTTGCKIPAICKKEVAQPLSQSELLTLAQTPPMGWNSWNPFGENVSEKVIRETADALVSSGIKRCRIYIYCN